MSQSITDRISDEYDKIRLNEELARNKRIADVHKNLPELEEIRTNITKAGQKAAMELSKNIHKEDEIRQKLNKEIEKLKMRKNQILKENGIDEDYDKIHFQCPLCEDTGRIGNERCRCYKSKSTKYTYEQSNLSMSMREINFDKFDFKYFSDEQDKNGISPLMRIKKAYNEAKSMTKNFDGYKKSFLFFGAPGTGKTFLSGCIATELLNQGYSVLYITAGKLFELMENKKYSRPRDENDDALIMSAYNCDLLILDDLGAEAPSKLAPSFAYEILNARMSDNKKMIINTGLDPDRLSEAYTQRFVSRLFEHFYALKFNCKDIRKQKMYE